MEGPLEPAIILEPKIANQPLGCEIATGGVVLMQGMDRDVIARRADGVR
jgi:hypothetical protein